MMRELSKQIPSKEPIVIKTPNNSDESMVITSVTEVKEDKDEDQKSDCRGNCSFHCHVHNF